MRLSVSAAVVVIAGLLFLPRGVAVEEENEKAAPGPATGTEGAEKAKKKHKPNRLLGEKSPYLLQHAYNPVDWYPWGEEAFKAARDSGKPIFLSIGYSTCHWCHVMERESFENEEIAKYLNEHFIAIKVDREERPDVDEVYMRAIQRAFRQNGGWPLSAFLTAAGKPFFMGTYFPPKDDPRRGRGFNTLLELVVDAWTGEKKAQILQAAEQVSQLLLESVGPKPGVAAWNRATLKACYDEFSNNYDNVHAGFSSPPRYAPKFPRTSTLDFLLAYHYMAGEKRALDMVTTTLRKMHHGGIYDHLGKGFHRYSVDRVWLVPHFEKMLYDNSLVPVTYVQCYRVTGDRYFLDVALECLEYLSTRMQHADGGFYSAEDADSEGEEGKYYVFSRKEIDDLLGKEAGKLFAERYGVVEGGNFEHTGSSVLHLKTSIDDLVKTHDKSAEEIEKSLAASRAKLLAVRAKRIPPLKDDKILTDWNGFALSAFALANQVTRESKYLDAAERAAAFIDAELSRDDKLIHRFRLGEARFPAYFDDYAFVVSGLLDLYEASLDVHYLAEAKRLAGSMVEQFWDTENGGFFQSGPQHEKLIVRTKEFYDGAIPAGNSFATRDLAKLAAYTGEARFIEKLEVMARLAPTLFETAPTSHPLLLTVATSVLLPRVDVVLVGRDRAAVENLAREVHRRYLPAKSLALVTPEASARVAAEIPWVRELNIDAKDAADGAYAMARRSGGGFQRFGAPGELGKFLDAKP